MNIGDQQVHVWLRLFESLTFQFWELVTYTCTVCHHMAVS